MIISPCISICKTDPTTGYCYGCGRTIEEKKIWKFTETTDQWKSRFPILLQAASGTTSVFTFAFIAGTDVTPDFSVGDIELVLGVEY